MSLKKTKPHEPITGRAPTRRTQVSSPTVPGAVEHVERVSDSIEYLRKRYPREHRAAERLRASHEVVYGQVGGVMDFERARGGSLPGSPPLPPYLSGAEDLNTAKRILYAVDHTLVTLVACVGMPIDKAAETVLRRKPSRPDKEEMGRRFRIGLNELADEWWSMGAGDKPTDEVRIWREAGARPTEISAGEVPKARAVHATGRRIFQKGR